MDNSTRLSFPYVMEAQAQKHVTVNETIRSLDALVHLSVSSRTVSEEPEEPTQGEGYILPSGKSGESWSGLADDAIAVWQDNAWREYPAIEGITAYVADEGRHIVWDGSEWGAFGSEEAARFGINTGPDDTNRLAVKTDAVFFSHDDITPGTGDMRQSINKASASDTASLLFQTGASGRVEIGLTGSDDLTIRVSADGETFVDAILIDHETGEVSFPNSTGIGGPSAPAWVPAGASFAISAEEAAVWTEATGPNSNLLSPEDAEFSAGSNTLILLDTGKPAAAATGAPRRSYDVAEGAWGYVIEAETPALPNGAPTPPALLGLDLTFDFVVDPVLGSDGNTGAPAAPLATLSELASRLGSLATSASVNVRIKKGDYVDDPLLVYSIDTNTITLVFEPGTTLRSTFTGVGSTQAFDMTDGTVILYGNGLHIRDWQGLDEIASDDFQSSSNGLAVHGSGDLTVHDVKVSNCGDGLTAHADGRLEAYRCWVEDCHKYAAVHVNDSTSYHEDCTFIGGEGHGGEDVRAPAGIIGGFEGSLGDHEFFRCRILPSPSGAVSDVGGGAIAIFDQCQFGTLTDYVKLTAAEVTDSFVHFYAQMNTFEGVMTRCYGKGSLRLRQGASAVPVFENCVFTGPAAGVSTSFLFANYDPGGFSELTIDDCIFTGYTKAIDLDESFSVGYWQASGSAITSSTFFGNTSDLGTAGAAEVGTTITDPLYTDPSLGSHSASLDMADYAAGSGTDGFGSGAAVTTGPAQSPADDVWSYEDLSALGLLDGQTVRFTATDDSVTNVILSGGSLMIPPGAWKEIYGPA
ncbi:DUF2793 domain-containing protein [Parvularcula marina]|uniref:DUF2793 domain-containing protein n=1 Tax=Parvularcula marina TaxID=2292771 RepID=UPI00351627E2